ncbi:CRISPR-associated endoribonuclease Cas2 [Paenibacillus montaniterrae]|uniref:CRISPR-associated endoribonuclease Cas2 n=1 Tax=Paenibacillus montaniterrae TaxID=429341 RepID=A0A920CSM2_9BACL|nr:ATP-binding protein [Paenibacillus montaniterrae]GIP14947.1 CRISPR-associated endoribonuclease Cas2 [Paenibacillus montaniterrae]
MNRFMIMTVGKTHSGKTTFANQLEAELRHAVVIDQDNHAEFINKHYVKLRPTAGANTLKFAVTNAIVEYAVQQSHVHIILSNSNLSKHGRSNMLRYFHDHGFVRIIVYFDLPIELLKERVEHSQRTKEIFRSASSFLEVLERQERMGLDEPAENEADHLFVMKSPNEAADIIDQIKALAC